jgi:type IV pilus assembly protein PilB
MANERQSTKGGVRASARSGARPLAGGKQVNALAELLGDLIEATGLVTPDRLAEARSDAGDSGSLIEALIEKSIVSSDRVAEVQAAHFHLPLVSLENEKISPEAATSIPTHVLERIVALPYKISNDRMQVAIADPSDVSGIDELKLAIRNYQVELAVAPREEILAEIQRMLRQSETLTVQSEALDDVEVIDEEQALDDLEADDGISDAPLVRLVNSIIFQAAEDQASDVHFMPEEDALVVRYRVDGVLQEVQRIPRRMASGVSTRLKVLAKLDIAERRKPQDGRISLNAKTAGRMLDIRVAVLPTVEGECVVMRLIDKSKKAPTLEGLGLADEMRESLEHIIKKPTGALLVTGPTGSGKSTTLYAALHIVSEPEVNVITVEDPVEYRLQGINQIQINAKAGLNFAVILRTILRADPDIVMVGEIRDSETAKISVEAALTGHMVLSSLHTNDAPSALTRLNEMGVEPYLTSAAVTGVLAQRLARRLCPNCAEMYAPSIKEMVEAGHRRRSRRIGLLSQSRLPALQPHGLQGPARHLRAPRHERRAGRLRGGQALARGAERPGDRAGNAHDVGRRNDQGGTGTDLDRGAGTCGRLVESGGFSSRFERLEDGATVCDVVASPPGRL